MGITVYYFYIILSNTKVSDTNTIIFRIGNGMFLYISLYDINICENDSKMKLRINELIKLLIKLDREFGVEDVSDEDILNSDINGTENLNVIRLMLMEILEEDRNDRFHSRFNGNKYM